MTGGHTFNEVFFTDVRLPGGEPGRRAERRLAAGQGDAGQRADLAQHRGVLWGNGPTALELLDSIRDAHPAVSPIATCDSASPQVYTEHTLLDLIRMRTLTAALKGQQPGPEASIRKILADEHGQHVMAAGPRHGGRQRDVDGRRRGTTFVPGTDTKGLGPDKPEGGLAHEGWYDGFMFSQALTIGGGTGEVQRNIVAERVLGLPHDVDVSTGMTWAESQRAGSRN